jgi:hypothetical protein
LTIFCLRHNQSVIRRAKLALAQIWCKSDRTDQASLEKINLCPAVHLAFDQLELGDLTFRLAERPDSVPDLRTVAPGACDELRGAATTARLVIFPNRPSGEVGLDVGGIRDALNNAHRGSSVGNFLTLILLARFLACQRS